MAAIITRSAVLLRGVRTRELEQLDRRERGQKMLTLLPNTPFDKTAQQ